MSRLRFAPETESIHEAMFTAEHEALRNEVRAFVDRELRPRAAEWEAAEEFPRDVFRRAGNLGLLGLKFSEDTGGSGPDFAADAVVTEELARCGSGGVAASIGAHKDLACLYLSNSGTAEQQQRWLTPAVAGETIGALAVTEPDAGSDFAALSTTARRDGDEWVLNGTKTFITNGGWADFAVVAARTGPGDGHNGLTLFVVDSASAGFVARRIRMLGWRPSQTAELTLQDVRVPDACRLGDEGGGFYAIMRNFAWERLAMALGQVAGAASTYEMARAYALERSAFGRPVGKFQVWRHRFAEMATGIEAGRALTYAVLRKHIEGEPADAGAAMAKLYTSELAFHIADECVQIHGGYGYTTEFDAERALRDARLGPIGGGTSQIMKEIVGRSLGL